ncbi:MAG: hypothetical protein B6D41_11810 [Chloroflexi bacterium UTCFX4]|jgi:hypothetical protein|nr:MAG: hypothetical protein B6D41_11810 [Chloroflexi bacterium UTCFX4]
MKNASVFYFSMRVALRSDERDALMRLSRSERRDPRAQAAMLIRRALENAGYLKNESMTDAERDAEGVNHAATN